MGDKSPKATSKHASQKKSRNDTATRMKQQATSAKQSAGKKK
jgi:hypothetical protein